MAEVALVLGRSTLIDAWSWALATGSAVILLRFRVNATWLILGGATIGILLRGLH
jgi:chromate transporter